MGKTRAECKQYADYPCVEASKSSSTCSSKFDVWRRDNRSHEEPEMRQTVHVKAENTYSGGVRQRLLLNEVIGTRFDTHGNQTSYAAATPHQDSDRVKVLKVNDQQSSVQPVCKSQLNGYEDESDSVTTDSDSAGYAENDYALNNISVPRAGSCTCEVAKEFGEIKQMLASLQHSVSDLRNRFHHERVFSMSNGSSEQYPRSKHSAYHQPDKGTWDVMQRYTCGNLAVILRKSPGWRKLVVNLLLKLFPKEVLLRSCVKGFSNTLNLPLDAEKLGALTNFVLAAYPGEELTETDINRVIHDKLRNLRSAEKLKQRAAGHPRFLTLSEPAAPEQPSHSTPKEENDL